MTRSPPNPYAGLLIAAACAFSGSALSRESPLDVTTYYDKFKEEVHIVAGQNPHPSRMGNYLIFNAAVKNKRAKFLAVTIAGNHESWAWLKCHSTAWLVDGKHLTLPQGDDDGDISSDGRVFEQISVQLTRGQLDRMAGADSLEWSICGSAAFSLSPESFKDLRALKSSLDAATK